MFAILSITDENITWVTFDGHSYLFVHDFASTYDGAQRVIHLLFFWQKIQVYPLAIKTLLTGCSLGGVTIFHNLRNHLQKMLQYHAMSSHHICSRHFELYVYDVYKALQYTLMAIKAIGLTQILIDV